MQEPAFQSQVLIQNNHEDWGLWSYIDKQVINALRSDKGYILIDITIEPLSDFILKQILDSLEDCSKFPKQFITRSFNGLSSTAEIDFKFEDDDVYESIIHQSGKVDLIYQMKISHYDYYKGFNHSFVHIDGNNVSFKAKRMSKKTLKIKNRGLNGGDLLIKMILYNPSNSKLKNISNEEYENFLNILNTLCNDK